jgi:paraquat-inducible protein B
MGLTANKRAIKITVFIYPQYASVVRRSSYFANVSGVHANIHLFGGSHVDLDSLRTVMRGGIAVHTANLSAEAAKNGDVFGVLTAAQVLSDD